MLVVSKNTGDSVTAAEINQMTKDQEGAITDTGQVLSAGNLTQVSTAMATYAAGGAFFTDSGAADAYVLTTVGSKRAPTAYFDGMMITFVPGNTNTGSSNVNVAGLGVKIIRNQSLTAVAGDILAGQFTTAIYVLSTDRFELTSVPKSGSIVQVANVQDGAVATGATVMVGTDAIPQITEGDEYMTLAVTPTKSTNKLKIEVLANLAHSSLTPGLQMALFQDATANALASGIGTHSNVANASGQVVLTHFMTAGTTSATTFRVRAGSSAGATTTFNGASGARLHGGAMASSITITEIEV